jgi:hypothetical protein
MLRSYNLIQARCHQKTLKARFTRYMDHLSRSKYRSSSYDHRAADSGIPLAEFSHGLKREKESAPLPPVVTSLKVA